MTTITAYLRGAFPRDTVKHVERALECSPRQAWRIVTTGRAPGKFRTVLLRAIDAAIERNKAELERLQSELGAIEYDEMLQRAAERRGASAAQDQETAVAVADAAKAARLDRRP